MISRRSAILIADLYQNAFRKRYHPRLSDNARTIIDTDNLYDFLYIHNYAAWFCNLIKKMSLHPPRTLQEFLMKIHTGESLVSATESWTWPQREQLGQRFLNDLAQDGLNEFIKSDNSLAQAARVLLSSLELDGYEYKGTQLLMPERDILDVKEKVGVLESLYVDLHLMNHETAFHCLKLSEEHYLAQRWDDSISNSRRFLEAVLQEVAASHSIQVNNAQISENIYDYPVRVRDYLEQNGLLDAKEKQALGSVYGLLSNTGSHPNIAEYNQAKLLRDMALTFAHFAMLRYQSAIKK